MLRRSRHKAAGQSIRADGGVLRPPFLRTGANPEAKNHPKFLGPGAPGARLGAGPKKDSNPKPWGRSPFLYIGGIGW